MKTRDYIDECRKHTETGSDYAVAKLLGISEDAVNSYRKGTRVMDNNTALAIAHVLRLPLEELIAAAAIEREKDPALRRKWETHLKRVAQRAAAVCAITLAAGFTPIGEKVTFASILDSGSSGEKRSDLSTNYATVRRTVRRWLAALRASMGAVHAIA